MSHTIKGKVTQIDTGDPVPGALVELWDRDAGPDDPLGTVTTNAAGKFQLSFGLADYIDFFPTDLKPDLYFVVHLGDEFLGSTKAATLWNLDAGTTKVEIQVDAPTEKKIERHIYLRVEPIFDYCPVDPATEKPLGVEYRRDCMRNVGHEDGAIPNSEANARTLDAIIYREYLDATYLVPKPDKLIAADINEPVFHRRVPGTVIYAKPGEILKVHVWNSDVRLHSFHIHGVEFGIDSDGAWPFGVESADGRRSDEICPGETWTYTLCVTEEHIGVWPFHSHRMAGDSIDRGLFGGLVVLPKKQRRPVVRVVPRVREVLDVVRNKFPEEVKVDPNLLIDPNFRYRVDVEIDFIRELMMHEGIKGLEPRARVIHAPLFFHRMHDGASSPIFDTGEIHELGGTAEVEFDTAGTFDYFCAIHPSMEGTVVVDPAADPGIDPVVVQIQDKDDVLNLPMGFYPNTVTVFPGNRVRWVNNAKDHHTATSKEGASLPTHCFNGRAFIGNSPTIVGYSGQTIRWYVFNLDLGDTWHNFHPHSQRWKFADQNVDVRSIGPAESFQAETRIPPVILLTDEMKKIQKPKHRPEDAELVELKGEFLFHCHVHHHMMHGMVGMVRAKQKVWLTPEMREEVESQFLLPLDDGGNGCPEVDMQRCAKKVIGTIEELPVDPVKVFMHAALLPKTNKVLYWGKDEDDQQTRIFDADTETVSPPLNQPSAFEPLEWDLWSAAHAFLDTPEGHLLAHGGFAGSPAVHSFLFDPDSNSWSQTGDTANGRFYPTTMTLDDGRILTMYGTGGPNSETLEIFTKGSPDPATGTWGGQKDFPAAFPFFFYPWTYLLPDGDLFSAGPQATTYKYDWKAAPIVPSLTEGTNAGVRGSNMDGTSVMFALRPPDYKVKVLITGGIGAAATQSTEIIDLSEAAPVWVEDPKWTLNQPRVACTGTLLPDGRVAVAGGFDDGGGTGGHIEVFDPQNPDQGWRLGPVLAHVKLYHSTMILLPDGTVLLGGEDNTVGPFERWYPDYYFLSRPTISNAPASVIFGAGLTIETPQASSIAEVVIVRPGAVTHGFDMSQRLVELEITATGAGTVDVNAPPNGNVAPPGWYLLFVLNGSRIPSLGRWMRLTT